MKPEAGCMTAGAVIKSLLLTFVFDTIIALFLTEWVSAADFGLILLFHRASGYYVAPVYWQLYISSPSKNRSCRLSGWRWR